MNTRQYTHRKRKMLNNLACVFFLMYQLFSTQVLCICFEVRAGSKGDSVYIHERFTTPLCAEICFSLRHTTNHKPQFNVAQPDFHRKPNQLVSNSKRQYYSGFLTVTCYVESVKNFPKVSRHSNANTDCIVSLRNKQELNLLYAS